MRPRALARAAIRRHSARKWSTSASLVDGPKLTRMKLCATSGGTSIAPARRFPSSCPTSKRFPPRLQSRQGRTAPAATHSQRLAARSQPIVAIRGAILGDDNSARRLDAFLEPGAQARKPLHVVGSRRERRGKSKCRRHVLRAAPIALLLTADRLERRKVPHQEHSDARRPAELVRAGGDEIGVGQSAACQRFGRNRRAAASPPSRIFERSGRAAG